jgi:hypothetical protein
MIMMTLIIMNMIMMTTMMTMIVMTKNRATGSWTMVNILCKSLQRCDVLANQYSSQANPAPVQNQSSQPVQSQTRAIPLCQNKPRTSPEQVQPASPTSQNQTASQNQSSYESAVGCPPCQLCRDIAKWMRNEKEDFSPEPATPMFSTPGCEKTLLHRSWEQVWLKTDF